MIDTRERRAPETTGESTSTARADVVRVHDLWTLDLRVLGIRTRESPVIDMHTACKYAHRMTTLQIRNIPNEAHRLLKARAAREGQSLSEFALSELLRSLERPTRREFLERLETEDSVEIPGGAASWVRAERDNR
ncbi:MAG: FitA-like ribbon-helix-helix domain-containing protein [Jiangellaceae bacterium]